MKKFACVPIKERKQYLEVSFHMVFFVSFYEIG